MRRRRGPATRSWPTCSTTSNEASSKSSTDRRRPCRPSSTRCAPASTRRRCCSRSASLPMNFTSAKSRPCNPGKPYEPRAHHEPTTLESADVQTQVIGIALTCLLSVTGQAMAGQPPTPPRPAPAPRLAPPPPVRAPRVAPLPPLPPLPPAPFDHDFNFDFNDDFNFDFNFDFHPDWNLDLNLDLDAIRESARAAAESARATMESARPFAFNFGAAFDREQEAKCIVRRRRSPVRRSRSRSRHRPTPCIARPSSRSTRVPLRARDRAARSSRQHDRQSAHRRGALLEGLHASPSRASAPRR